MTELHPLRAVLNEWEKPPADMVGSLPKGGTELDYMGHAAVTRALIMVDPEWSWEPVVDERGIPIIEREGKRLVLWGSLTVLGKTVVCCGTCEDRKFEPEKELIGDLLRNGAMRFGIGLSLWSKDEWGDLKPESPPADPEVVQVLVDGLNSITDEEVRKRTKGTFVRNFGMPQTITAEQAPDALAFVESRTAEVTDG